MEFDYCEVTYKRYVIPAEIFDNDGNGEKTLFELLNNNVYAIEEDRYLDKYYDYDKANKIASILSNGQWFNVDNKQYLLITRVCLTKILNSKIVDTEYYGYKF